MTAVEMLHRDDYRLLRTVEDPVANAHWCFMHAQRFPRDMGYRACFTPALIREIREFQKRTSDRLTLQATSRESRLAHLVLASDANVFNLGGDLDLFCRLIRARNHEHLLAYARQCVEGVHGFHAQLNRHVHTVALVQGDALGGGFEAALSCHSIVAESGVGMGFPEVLFDLFPGMGAYSFLCQRVSPRFAEEMMMNGTIYSSDELHRLGIVDVLVPKGEGVAAVNDLIRRNQRIPHARAAMNRVRELRNPASLAELMQITEVWVDTAMQLGEKSLRTMERIVRAQRKRPDGVEEPAVATAQPLRLQAMT
jgi:DSF synthase